MFFLIVSLSLENELCFLCDGNELTSMLEILCTGIGMCF